ncbi:hypothetical protein MKS88_000456 [Plasmodium brasilianum]|uniref:Ubiquitin-like domain-containing protein n=2 Tax=Plasmodium (Plasmodium) TaxID=418103 RepID=A0A1A8VM09_PLAMA|nr:conserved Plasmodium protein, unknown function [Plasmodium malariae]KAI4841218.1 hypothetical protein MKS88_000456 [Plasmodium brasilianum]SBS81350.1 conserved Plasmodium protein, unknown function [Plasmodium malariae]SBT86903.1 conserved Plasmodium protein, unknown function [Plasmodium malariae]
MEELSRDMTLHLKDENKKKEKKIETENIIQINFHLPDGSIRTHNEKASIEVGYIKLRLSKKLQIPYDKINLIYNNNIMLDPLSIIDIIKTDLDIIDIYVSTIH